jgi:hypothetical protein
MELFSYKYAIPYLIFLGYLIVLIFVEFKKLITNKMHGAFAY